MENSFLLEIIGESGCKALNGAAERFPLLKSILLPRAIVAWISTVGKLGFEGPIPSLEGSYLSLTKDEDNTYTGAMTIKDELYTFNKADILHVSASVGVALNLEVEPIDDRLKKKDLTQLGSGIDLLVKSNIIKKNKKSESEEESKDAGKGKMGGTLQPLKPESPVKPQMGQEPPKANMASPKPSLKVSKSESQRSCSLCGEGFFKNDSFVGCRCLSALGSFVKTELQKGDFLLKFDRKLDKESIDAIISALKSCAG
jgi:hypothetical protein